MNTDGVVAWLYVPGSRPELFAKAHAAADGIVVDLEDAVLPSARERARGMLDSLGSLSGKPIVVRVNEVGSADFARDLAAVRPLVTSGIVQAIRIPKVDTRAEVDEAARAVADWPVERPIICQLESARAIHGAFEIAGHPAVRGVMLGEADLRADLGLPRDSTGEGGLALARQTVVLASRANGLGAPVASAFTGAADADRLREDTELMRQLGFHGRSCVHPRQVPVVREVFAPDPADLAWAREVVDAAEAARTRDAAAVALGDGTFVDPAVERQARDLLRAIHPSNSAAPPSDGGRLVP